MRSGRKSEAQTPSPKKDRIYGSKRNPKGSASSSKSASNIEFTESTIKTLENKRDEYNAKHPNKKVTLATLKAVFRRGAGAFSSSHRPNMTRSGWAFARVNKFLLKKGGTKVKKAYVQDDDLMANGGKIKKEKFDFSNSSIVLKKSEEEEFVYNNIEVPSEQIIYWLYDVPNSQNKVDNGIFDELQFGEGINTIWEKEYQSKHKGSENLIGVAKIRINKNKTKIYILTMTTKPSLRRMGIMSYLISKIREEYNIDKNDVLFVGLTSQGKKFYSRKKYNYGGDLGQEITCVNCGWHWNTNQSDEFDKYICHKCLFDNRTFYDSDPIGEYHLGGDMSLHLAPNDKPSNLTHEQWHLVRTPEFKAWFGDWENDPENASKVVDENGEPMVMWHYSKRLQYEGDKFYTFRVDKQLGSHFGTIKQAQNLKYIPSGESEVITSNKELSDFRYYKVFLNIKNPLRLIDVGIFDVNTLTDVIGKNLKSYDWEYINNYTKESKDSLLDRVKNVVTKNLGYDGVVYLNRYESEAEITLINSLEDSSDTIFKNKVPSSEDSWIAFYPNQIKLPDGTNTTFDANNMDIRYEDGGKLKNPHTIIEIAEKHNIKVSEVVEALIKGQKMEREHTNDDKIAKTIAQHHLWESPKYYEKLKEMEETFEDGGIFVLDEIALPDTYANIETLKRVLANQGYEIVKSVKNKDIFETGGIVVGKSHQESDENGTGEKFKLKSTGQIVELEGGEAVIVGSAIDSEDTISFNGEEKTPREIASYLNHAYGGVKFEKGGHITCGCSHKKYYHGGELPSAVVNSLNGGEAVITKKTMESQDKYEYEGERLTPRQILSRINHRYGGVSFAKGGKLTKFTNNPINIASKMIYFVNNIIYA